MANLTKEARRMKLEEILPLMRAGRRARCEQVHIQKIWLTLEEIGIYKNEGSLLGAFLQGDWELEPLPEQKIEVTRKELRSAWEMHVFRPLPHACLGDIHFENLCRELGFKNET